MMQYMEKSYQIGFKSTLKKFTSIWNLFRMQLSSAMNHLKASPKALVILLVLMSGISSTSYHPKICSELASLNPSIELIESDYIPTPTVEFVGFTGELPIAADYRSPFENEISCIALNVYHEARGSTIEDQIATAHVVMNRVASSRYPDTPCEVVYQPYQFSWTHDEIPNMPRDDSAYELAKVVATQVMFGYTEDITGGATHYHTTEINPYWSRYSVNETVIGAHIYMNLTR